MIFFASCQSSKFQTGKTAALWLRSGIRSIQWKGWRPGRWWVARSPPFDSEEGLYVDEEGNVFRLLDKGETKPIEVEHVPVREKTGLEVLLEASLEEKKPHRTKRRFEEGATKKSKQRPEATAFSN
jgi:hypothetical protein